MQARILSKYLYTQLLEMCIKIDIRNYIHEDVMSYLNMMIITA